MKTRSVNWDEFFNPKCTAAQAVVFDLREIQKAVIDGLMNKETIIKVAGVTLILTLALPQITHAAGTGIDVAASKIYRKLLNVGKWVIIVKGGVDTIQNVVQGDMHSAKKNFLGYMLVYTVLLALPWGLNQVDSMFSDMEGQ